MTMLLIIIPAADQAAANAWFAANIDPVGGAQTFTVALNASGNATDGVSHYWACGAFKSAQVALIQAQPGWTTETYNPATQPAYPAQTAAGAGLQPVQTEPQALQAQAAVS